MNSANKVSREKWLEAGYKHFAEFGPDNLSIKKISNKIGASRSSFYHYFGEMDIYITELLKIQWLYAEEFIKVGKIRCKNLYPDLYELLSENSITLKFSLQLFRNRSNPEYNFLFIKAFEASTYGFALKLFKDQYKFEKTDQEIYNLWLTLGETWYSRLNTDDLSAKTMQKHAEDIMKSVIKFIDSQFYSTLNLK